MSVSWYSSLASISFSEVVSLGVNRVKTLFSRSGPLLDNASFVDRRGIMMPLSAFMPRTVEVSSSMTNMTNMDPNSDK